MAATRTLSLQQPSNNPESCQVPALGDMAGTLQCQSFFLTLLEPLMHNSTTMNRLNKEQRTKIIAALDEGNSLRATAHICDVAFNTVLKLLPAIGQACEDYQAGGPVFHV